MAVKLADAVAYLRTDDKELKSGLGQADAEVSGWAGKLSGAIGGAAVGIAAAAGAALVGATIAVGKAALDISSEVATATANLGAQLGIQADEAARFADVATAVYGNNFAESVTDAANAVAQVARQFGLAADDPSLQRITENAFRLKDVFGTEVSESVSAVQTLMTNFGLTSEQAFDMLANGYQLGLNRSNDFIDTIEEYSTQFANGGASAEQFFSLLDSGLAGGMLGTDRAADLFKEFRVRIQDGSDTTRNALLSIGLDADTMAQQFAGGSLNAATAFTMVQEALRTTGDQNLQFQAGVALLGTQFEDLGTSAALGIDLAAYKFTEIGGTIDSLDAKYNTFGDMMEGVGRELQVSLAPLGDKLFELAQQLMPLVVVAVEALIAVITPLIGWLVDGIDALFGIATANDQFVGSLNAVAGSLGGVFGPAMERAQELLGVVGEAVQAQTDGPLNFFNEWIAQNMPRIQQIVESVLGAITAFWEEHGAAIMAGVQRYLGGVMEFWELIFRTILNIVQVGLQLLTGDFEGAGQTLQNIVRDLWTSLSRIFSQMIDAIVNLWSNVNWSGIGQAIIEGIADGLRNAAGWLRDAAWSAAMAALEAAREALGIHSPSAVAAEEIGSPFAEGIGAGMREGMAALAGDVNAGLRALMGGVQAPALAGAAGPLSVTINISGASDPAGVGLAARNGVLAGLRAAGYR